MRIAAAEGANSPARLAGSRPARTSPTSRRRNSLPPEREAGLAAPIEAGPDFERDGVARWRRVDPRQVIRARWNIADHQRTRAKLLRRLGFRHISARSRDPGQDPARIEEFKKTLPSGLAS